MVPSSGSITHVYSLLLSIAPASSEKKEWSGYLAWIMSIIAFSAARSVLVTI